MNNVEIECTDRYQNDQQDKKEFSVIFTQLWVDVINKKVQQES